MKTITTKAPDGNGSSYYPWFREYRNVLCVCRGGYMRSPTAAWLLGNAPYNCNTRSCGIDPDIALIPLTHDLIKWADEIVTFEPQHCDAIRKLTDRPVRCLNIPDRYGFRDPELIRLIKNGLKNERS